VFFLLAFLVRETHGALFAKRWIGEYVIVGYEARCHQGVIGRDRHLAIHLTDVMQKHVHQTEPSSIGANLVAVKSVSLQKGLLILVELIVVRVGDEIVGSEEETAGSTGRISDSLTRLRPDAFDHCADKRARGEILRDQVHAAGAKPNFRGFDLNGIVYQW